MNRDNVIDTINQIIGLEFLAKAAQKDDMANGVQILGSEEVTKIALGVSCNEAFLEKAVDWGAHMCIFHHGLDVRTHKSQFPIYQQKRLRQIFKNDLTILGFHYALDAHSEIGNNAVIIQKLSGEKTGTLFDEWGFVAKLKSAKSLKTLKEECEALFDHPVVHFGDDEREVQTIGVVSGGGKPYAEELQEMIDKNVELYISGETSESAPHKMIEAGINYFVCGHYATETFGVKSLGEKLSEQLSNVEVEFIDIPNPI